MLVGNFPYQTPPTPLELKRGGVRQRIMTSEIEKIRNNSRLKSFRRELRNNLTEAEKMLWWRLRSRQVKGLRFLRQYSLGPYVLDFFCPEISLAIEVDGGQHNETENKIKDEERTRYLEKQKIKVIRYWNNEVLGNIEGVMEDIFSTVPKAKES